LTSEKQITVRQIVADFYRRAGVCEPIKPELFWKKLEKKHGDLGRRFGRAVDARALGNNSVDPYALKNETPALSLDITSQYESRLYRDFVEWLVREGYGAPNWILDVGCGNGILTCLVATLFPESKIVGIDVEPGGIDIGKSIVATLGLSNVEFICAKLYQLPELFPNTKFDLAIAAKVFYEVLDLPSPAAIVGHSIQNVEIDSTDVDPERSIAAVRDSLSPGGSLLALDRWSSPESVVWWVRSAEKAGLRLSLDRSFMLKTSETGASHTFPITVFSAAKHLPCPTNEQILALFTYPDVVDALNKIGPTEGPLAEALFSSFGNALKIAGFEATYHDGSGSLRSQLFVSGSVSGLYSTWSTGKRHLFLATSIAVKDMLQHLRQTALEQQKHCDVKHDECPTEDVLLKFGVSPN
jgi:SAM-dependent methyltransferase